MRWMQCARAARPKLVHGQGPAAERAVPNFTRDRNGLFHTAAKKFPSAGWNKIVSCPVWYMMEI